MAVLQWQTVHCRLPLCEHSITVPLQSPPAGHLGRFQFEALAHHVSKTTRGHAVCVSGGCVLGVEPRGRGVDVGSALTDTAT